MWLLWWHTHETVPISHSYLLCGYFDHRHTKLITFHTVKRGLTTVWLLWSQAHQTVPIWHTDTTRVNYRVVIVIIGTRNRSVLIQWNNQGELPCGYCDHKHTKQFPFGTQNRSHFTQWNNESSLSCGYCDHRHTKPFSFNTVKQRGLITVWLLWSEANETVPFWHSKTTPINYRVVIVITGTRNRSHLIQWDNEG